MATINLVRIDFRLIHGQVITKWLKQSGANRIIIIDDELSKDEFMASIYTMAAPSNVSVEVLSVNDTVSGWDENQLGEGKLFILARDVNTIYQAKKAGVPIEAIQIGGLGAGLGRVKVFGPIYLDQADMDQLEELDNDGISIYLHQVPDEPKMDFNKAKEKFNSLT